MSERYRHYGFAAHPPGVVSEYSNLGYGLLGELIAEQSGQPLAAFLEREVFRPLGMRDTVMGDPVNGARKYDASGKPLPQTFNGTPGAGNIYASVHDLVRFGMFHLDDRPSRVLSNASKELNASGTRRHPETGVRAAAARAARAARGAALGDDDRVRDA